MMTACFHTRVEFQVDPESGDTIFPWMTADGYGVESDGSVQGCRGDVCEQRREPLTPANGLVPRTKENR